MEQLLEEKKYDEIKKILWLKNTNEDEIEAKTKINYYKYLMKELIKEKQVWKKEKVRITWNKTTNIWGIRKKDRQEDIECDIDKQRILEFWKGIYEKEEDPTQNDWTREILTNNEWIETGILITKEEIQKAIKRIPNWKASGNDQIQGYWYKYLNNVIDCLESIFKKWILNPENIPETVCKGITVLIYKSGDINNPKN